MELYIVRINLSCHLYRDLTEQENKQGQVRPKVAKMFEIIYKKIET